MAGATGRLAPLTAWTMIRLASLLGLPSRNWASIRITAASRGTYDVAAARNATALSEFRVIVLIRSPLVFHEFDFETTRRVRQRLAVCTRPLRVHDNMQDQENRFTLVRRKHVKHTRSPVRPLLARGIDEDGLLPISRGGDGRGLGRTSREREVRISPDEERGRVFDPEGGAISSGGK